MKKVKIIKKDKSLKEKKKGPGRPPKGNCKNPSKKEGNVVNRKKIFRFLKKIVLANRERISNYLIKTLGLS